jgi:hypothetical protein
MLNKIAGRKFDLFGSVQGCVEYQSVPLISKVQGDQKVCTSDDYNTENYK